MNCFQKTAGYTRLKHLRCDLQKGQYGRFYAETSSYATCPLMMTADVLVKHALSPTPVNESPLKNKGGIIFVLFKLEVNTLFMVFLSSFLKLNSSW